MQKASSQEIDTKLASYSHSPANARAKDLAYKRFLNSLKELTLKPKYKGFGEGETADSLWDKLPEASKQYWLLKGA